MTTFVSGRVEVLEYPNGDVVLLAEKTARSGETQQRTFYTYADCAAWLGPLAIQNGCHA